MRKFRTKKIWLDKRRGKYCIVKLFRNKIDMQDAYKKACPGDTNQYKCLGAHNAYEKLRVEKDGTMMLINETGTVYVCMDHCGAGIISHELMHAVLWAIGHRRNKKQYPIIIKNMAQEEILLHNHTLAVTQFYRWYWGIEKSMK